MITEDTSSNREKILNQAGSLFARKGYAGTSLREICKTSGVSRRQMLEIFEDKWNLYLECLDRATGIFLRKLRKRQEENDTAIGKFKAVLSVMADLYQEDNNDYGILDGGMRSKHAEAYSRVIRFHDQVQLAMQAAIEEGTANGEFRNVDPVSSSSVIMAAAVAIQGWASLPVPPRVFKGYPPKDLMRVATDWMVSLLLPETEAADGAKDASL